MQGYKPEDGVFSRHVVQGEKQWEIYRGICGDWLVGLVLV